MTVLPTLDTVSPKPNNKPSSPTIMDFMGHHSTDGGGAIPNYPTTPDNDLPIFPSLGDSISNSFNLASSIFDD